MKLLLDEEIEKSEGNITIVMRPVTTSHQAHIMGLASKSGIEAQVALTTYALNTLIKKVTIDSVDYNPADLAKRADLSNDETVQAMVMIGGLVVQSAFPSGEDEKK